MRGLVLLLLGLTGCGGQTDEHPPHLSLFGNGAVAGCEEYGLTACDITASDCQSRAFETAACLREVEAGSSPETLVISLSDLEAILRSELSQADSTDGDLEQGAALLGLVEPADLDIEAQVEDGLSAIGGFYVPETGVVYVVDRSSGDASDTPELSDSELVAVLVHEYIHALQARQVDLQAWSETDASTAATTDELLAFSATLEGEASLFQFFVLLALERQRFGPTEWEALNDLLTDEADQAGAESGSPLLSASSIFPYTYGFRYAYRTWSEHGVGALRDQAKLERSTRDVIDLGDSSPQTTPGETATEFEPPEGYERVASDTLGAWIVYSFLSHQPTDQEQASADSREWLGDRFEIYRDEADSQLVAAWRVRYADTEAATRTAEAFNEARPANGARWRALADGGEATLIAAETQAALDDWLPADP